MRQTFNSWSQCAAISAPEQICLYRSRLNTIRYDTLGEFNLDSKAEYTA